MNPTERARRASAGLLAYAGITQRRAADTIGMNEKRLSERIAQGSLYLRDFLEIAHAEGCGDYLRMLADQIDDEEGEGRPIDAAMLATEAATDAQRTIRTARADGKFCHYEVLQIREAAADAHATATRLKSIADQLEPGPVRADRFAAE